MPQTITRRKDLTSEQERTYWIFWSAPKCVFFSKEPLIRLSAGLSGHKVNCRNSTCLQKGRFRQIDPRMHWRLRKTSKFLGNPSLQWCVNVLHWKTSNQGLYNIFSAFSLVENLFCKSAFATLMRKEQYFRLSKSSERWNFRHYFCAFGKTEHVEDFYFKRRKRNLECSFYARINCMWDVNSVLWH